MTTKVPAALFPIIFLLRHLGNQIKMMQWFEPLLSIWRTRLEFQALGLLLLLLVVVVSHMSGCCHFVSVLADEKYNSLFLSISLFTSFFFKNKEIFKNVNIFRVIVLKSDHMGCAVAWQANTPHMMLATHVVACSSASNPISCYFPGKEANDSPGSWVPAPILTTQTKLLGFCFRFAHFFL